MAEFIDGDNTFFKASIYGAPDWKAMEFLSNQYNNISAYAKDSSMEFFNNAKMMFDKLSGSTAMRMARQAGAVVGSMWDTDDIRHLKTLLDIQVAKSTMQRWIMANPVVREMYHNQQLDGYSDSYIDLHPNDIGENHYDYRRVMNGIAVEVGERLLCTTYPDELFDEKELSIEEQVDIKMTWDEVERLIRLRQEDPTSKWGNSL